MEKFRINNDYAEIWIEDGIIYNIYKINLVITLEVAMRMVSDRLKVSNGRAYPLFIDISGLVSADIKARKYLSSEEATKLATAGALITTNPLAKFAGNIFISINQPKVPSRIFTNKESAIEWLQQYK